MQTLKYKAIKKSMNLGYQHHSLQLLNTLNNLDPQNAPTTLLYSKMHSQSLILAALPLLAHAVDIIQFAVDRDTPPNTECNLYLDGAYFMCGGIEAETCCANFWPGTVNSISFSGLNSTQTDGRQSDSFDVFNGEVGGDPCALSANGFSCGGGGGFDNFCFGTNGECGATYDGGSMWHSGDVQPKGRFAKRAGVVKPNVAGLYDAAEDKHRQFSIGDEVPAEVVAAIVEAVKANVEYKDLDESVKAFEITN
jgi:hypothetical protein